MAPDTEQCQARADPIAPTMEQPPLAEPTTTGGDDHGEERPASTPDVAEAHATIGAPVDPAGGELIPQRRR